MTKKKTVFIRALVVLLGLLVINQTINKNVQITNKIEVNSKIPEAFNGFTIVQISDFHNATFGEDNKNFIRKIAELDKVDIIVITGDLIDSRHTDVEVAIKLVQELTKIAPTYYITGNHEFRMPEELGILEKAMMACGVNVVRNASTLIERENQFIQLIGVDDYTFYAGAETEIEDEVLDEMQKTITSLNNKEFFSVLLSHRPGLLQVYSDSNVDLVFSGHTHGGQIRLPFIGGILAPDDGFLPYYDGDEEVYELGDTDMFISRGIGNSLFPLRIYNRPEIIVAKLYNTKK